MDDSGSEREKKVEIRLYFITLVVAIAVAWGALHQQVTDHGARLDRHDVEISTLKENIGSQAVVLGHIEQKIDDLRCAADGKGCK